VNGRRSKVDAIRLIRLPSISGQGKANDLSRLRNAVLISGAISAADVAGDQASNPARAWWENRRFLLLVAILLVAALLRLYHLGRDSLWYDEVVTMRLARTESPAALVRLLGQIDATRAPLHPLLLQGWVALFGPFDYTARLFSGLCGI